MEQEDFIKYVWEAHNFEIKNLWQRSILLVPLIVMAFTAMGILQLKIIDDITNSKDECMPLLCAELFVCNAGVILSLFWVALAKASKFIQEAHEGHLKRYLGKCSMSYKKAYCDLNKFEKILKRVKKTSLWCPLKAYRFSPSKINIALGWFSTSIFVYVFIVNLLLYFCEIDICRLIELGIITLIINIINILLLFFAKEVAMIAINQRQKMNKNPKIKQRRQNAKQLNLGFKEKAKNENKNKGETMRIFQGLLTGFMGLAVLLTGCGDGDSDSNFSLSSSEPLVSVALQDDELHIDILDNDLQIQDIVVNRGNCWVVDAFSDTIEYTGKFSDRIYKVNFVPKIFYGKADEAYLNLSLVYLESKKDIYTEPCFAEFYDKVNKKEGYQACRIDDEWDKILKEHDNDYPSAYLAYAESIQKEYNAPEDFMKTIKEALKEFQEAEMFFIDEIKKRKPTKKYQFGDKIKVDVYDKIKSHAYLDHCNVREAVIKTNKGNWSFGWGQH